MATTDRLARALKGMSEEDALLGFKAVYDKISSDFELRYKSQGERQARDFETMRKRLENALADQHARHEKEFKELRDIYEKSLSELRSALTAGGGATTDGGVDAVLAVAKMYDEKANRHQAELTARLESLGRKCMELEALVNARIENVLVKLVEAVKSLPQPVVHNHVPEQYHPAPVVNVTVPEAQPVINVTPEVKSIVNVPDQPAPTVTVQVPEAKPRRKTIDYDEYSRPRVIVETEE